MNIKVLGSGCPNCQLLKHNVEEALKKLNMNGVEVDYITDVNEMVNYGVMTTPALVIDKEVKIAGRVPEVDELTKIITD